MMMHLREIQAAHRLGFQEIADFRTAVKRGVVPGPSRKLPIGRRLVDAWSSDELDLFIDNSSERRSDSSRFEDEIGALA